MKRIIEFLNALEENNNKPWFDANKVQYLQAKAIFEDLTQDLIEKIGRFDPSVRNLTVKDCTYRIYRDIRFSKDKTPYKTHFGAFICPGGRKSGLGGYYFHIEGARRQYLSSHLLATGAVCLERDAIASIREDVYSLCDEFERVVGKARGFALDRESAMKLGPKGFPKDCKAYEYLKLRDFVLSKPIDEKFVLSPDLASRVCEEFARTKEFNDFINRALRAKE